MANIDKLIAQFSNPTPVFNDPEDDGDLTKATLVTKDAGDFVEVENTNLRKKAALTTGDLGSRYVGKKVSRKSLLKQDLQSDGDSGETDDEKSSDSTEDEEEGQESKSFEDKSDDDIDEEEISSFKSQFFSSNGKKVTTQEENFSDSDDEDEGGDDMNQDDDEDDDDDDDEESGSDEDNADSEDEEDEENIQQFSKKGDDAKKGKACKAQLGMWDTLLELRIKMQKIAVPVNQLPHGKQWAAFKHEGGETFCQKAHEAEKSLNNLLFKLVKLQTCMLLLNKETQQIYSKNTNHDKQPAGNDADQDEEITSESEAEKDEKEAISSKTIDKSFLQRAGIKRKLKLKDYPEFLSKRNTEMMEYRNGTIQRWYDKTRLAGGKISSKAFSGFDQSAVKQINQILGDKERLIKRTQINRGGYRVLGQSLNNSDAKKEDSKITQDEEMATNFEELNEEIFDDSDFYHQQLRELIERKTTDTDDPVMLSKQWLEIQKLRKKIKKKVDTKASKGRKLRFNIHKKLVNFMAPEDRSTWSDEARDDLFKSLFGKQETS